MTSYKRYESQFFSWKQLLKEILVRQPEDAYKDQTMGKEMIIKEYTAIKENYETMDAQQRDKHHWQKQNVIF